MDEGAAEEAAQSSHSILQPRERADGPVCHHWQSGGPLQGTQSVPYTLTRIAVSLLKLLKLILTQ